MAPPLHRFLAHVVLPAWSAAGIADWALHRATRIERTAGVRESVMHLVMGAEGAACALAGLVFEIDAGVLALMFAAALAHEATAAWDVAFAAPRRRIVQAEQHTHSFMEALPFAACAVAAVLHPHVPRRAAFRRARTTLGARSIAVAAAAGAAGGIVHVEEFVRCVRANAGRG